MAIIVASAVTLSTAANTKTADLVSGRNQYVGKGTITLIAKGSAAGMNATLNVGGVALIDDLPLATFGATGGMSALDSEVLSQVVAGGRVEFFLRNTSGGALTTDYQIKFTPM
jgi:hypothetical protein